nr:hypothetical protein Itr_chr14CG14840 [Ipomoea trifida]
MATALEKAPFRSPTPLEGRRGTWISSWIGLQLGRLLHWRRQPTPLSGLQLEEAGEGTNAEGNLLLVGRRRLLIPSQIKRRSEDVPEYSEESPV